MPGVGMMDTVQITRHMYTRRDQCGIRRSLFGMIIFTILRTNMVMLLVFITRMVVKGDV